MYQLTHYVSANKLCISWKTMTTLFIGLVTILLVVTDACNMITYNLTCEYLIYLVNIFVKLRVVCYVYTFTYETYNSI